MNDIFRVTEEYIQQYFGNIARAVARKINLVEQPDVYSTNELLDIMRSVPSHPLVQAMNNFFRKYRSWHAFILEREKDGVITSTDPVLNAEHIRLMDERDKARGELEKGLSQVLE